MREALERGELRRGTDPHLIADLLVGPQFLRLFVPFDDEEAARRYPEAVLETVWRGIEPAEP